jgi:threonylcarbamoyladenosine tRNA methylthiotransferase MtaB
MPAVPVQVRRARAARLREAGRQSARRFLADQVTRTVSVLTETAETGHSEHFAAVRLAAPAAPGRIVSARVVGVDDEALVAEAA